MESTIGQRIRQLREAKQISVAAFAKAAGVKPSAIYGLEGGANRPSMNTVTKLQKSFPDLNTDWLLTGTGSMYRDGHALTPVSQLPATAAEEPQPPRYNSPIMRAVPDLSHLTPEQQAEYWFKRWEKAATRLAEYQSEQEHEEAVQLIRSAGGRSFSEASADAADEYEPGPMAISHRSAEAQTHYVYQRYVPARVQRPARIVVTGFGS